MDSWLTPLLGVVVFVLLLLLVHSRIELEQRVAVRLERFRERELDKRAQELFERWRLEDEPAIRRDAVKRSQSVVTGKVTEHLVPLLGTFPYDPRDVRFLGTPVDLVVFDGLSRDALDRVVFVEVKTGPSASLSPRERKVRDCILSRRVAWEELRIGESGQPSS